MAKNKIIRIEREIELVKEKINEYQNKLKELELKKTEIENLQIVQTVRALNLTPQELSKLLSKGGIPGIKTVSSDIQKKEETDNEK